MFALSPTRQGPRFSLSLPLRIWFRGRVEERPPSRKRTIVVEETLTNNISANGCHFFLSHKLEVGTKVEMEIAVPVLWTEGRAKKIRCRGRIIRVEDECGCERIGVTSTIEHCQFAAAPEDQRVQGCFRPNTEN